MKRYIKYCLATLCIVSLILVIERLKPMAFTEILPIIDSDENICSVFSIDKELVHLSNSEFKNLIKELEECRYYYNGKSNGTYYGELYHIYIGKTNELPQELIITDDSLLYIDNKVYRIKPNSNMIIKNLQ